MFNPRLVKGCALSSLLVFLLSASGLPVLAQTPYWDNSGGNNNFYAPQNNNAAPNNNPYYNNGNNQPNVNNPQQFSQQQQQQPFNNQQPNLKGYVSTAPSGSTMVATLNTFLSSDSASVGTPVAASLGAPLMIGGNMVLPAGSIIQGQVASVTSSGRTGRNGQLTLRFNRAQLPDGRVYPLSAKVVTPDGSGVLKAGTTRQRVGRAAGNAAAGAAAGALAGLGAKLIFGGSRNAGTYALRGAGAGALAGGAYSVFQKGNELELQPGTPLDIVLDQPLTITSDPAGAQNNGMYYNNNNYNTDPGYNGGGYTPY